KCFKFVLDEEEKKQMKELLKVAIFNNTDVEEEKINDAAEKFIKKNLIFKFLKNKWEVVVTDDTVKKSLEEYYEKTNEPIRNILNNKEEFEKVKNSIVEEQIIKKILATFKIKLDLEKANKEEQK
ncbi:MAG: hypothetical protein LBD05_02860, partial [Mycoplasmataceae bacterium]|nr:hypothetical protein [Mycoplasmataceae bacterium]